MSNSWLTDRPPRKKSIAVQVRNIQVVVLLASLCIIGAIAAVIITGITNSAAADIARLYSTEALRRFNYYMIQDLVLMEKVSRSSAIRNWFSDEEDPAKKAVAFNEMMDYLSILRDSNLYLAITEATNEYSVTHGTTYDGFSPYAKLDPANPEDDWYYECIKSKYDYNVNIDIDKKSRIPRIWINHKVMENDRLLGIFCSGLLLDEMINCLFAQYDNKTTKGFIIDRDGHILIDVTLSISYIEEKIEGRNRSRIYGLSADPLFTSIMESYLHSIDGYFGMEDQPTVVMLKQAPYGHVSIAPVVGTDWSIVTFFNKDSLYSVTKFLPLTIAILLAFIICTLANGLFIHRLLLKPLDNLTRSLSASKFYAGEIYGSTREDEIGELALTIQKMRDRLSTYNAELLRAARERERLIRIDQLTDIPNRRSFDERLPLEWGRSVRTQTPISLLILDLDHFKQYNDTYGHLQGDKALQAVAKVFTRELKRSGDLVARWGGEEFAILLVNTDLNGALDVGERICQGVESLQIPLDDGTMSKMTISVGVNCLIPMASNILEDFIRHTDMALYAAKREGRNRVCHYTNALAPS